MLHIPGLLPASSTPSPIIASEPCLSVRHLAAALPAPGGEDVAVAFIIRNRSIVALTMSCASLPGLRRDHNVVAGWWPTPLNAEALFFSYACV